MPCCSATGEAGQARTPQTAGDIATMTTFNPLKFFDSRKHNAATTPPPLLPRAAVSGGSLHTARRNVKRRDVTKGARHAGAVVLTS